jgi:YD repeat-containing protein
MKTFRIYHAAVLTSIGLLLAQCNTDQVDSASEMAAACSIESSVNEIQSSNHKQTEIRKYVYDSQGNLSKMTCSVECIETGDKKSSSVTTTTYQYNAAGFLTTKATETISNEVTKSLETKTYSYENQLLARVETQTTNSQGATTTTIETYKYGTGGVLSTRETRLPNSNVATYTYDASGKLTDYTLRTTTGLTKPYTIQDGLVTKITGQGSYTVHRYNNQRQVEKTEIFVNDKLNSYMTFEWANMRSPESTLPAFKGFPKEAYEMGVGGVLAKYQYFGDTGLPSLRQLNESVYVHQKNQNELVTQTSLTNQQMAARPNDPTEVIKSRQTFNYNDCK